MIYTFKIISCLLEHIEISEYKCRITSSGEIVTAVPSLIFLATQSCLDYIYCLRELLLCLEKTSHLLSVKKMQQPVKNKNSILSYFWSLQIRVSQSNQSLIICSYGTGIIALVENECLFLLLSRTSVKIQVAQFGSVEKQATVTTVNDS